MKPDVSIIILTYNNYPYTRACLKSIRKWTTTVAYELIIVDNASTDGTARKVREFNPDVVIENKRNRGFAAGNNQGLAASKGRWVLFLNNDVIVTPHWLDGLLAPHLEDQQVAASGPLTNAVSGSQLISSVGYNLKGPNSPTWEMEKFARQIREKNSGLHQRVARLVGFCLLCRKGVLEQLGSFDEIYGIGNFEDDDLCFRMLAAGFHLVRTDDVFIHHWGSLSFRQKGAGYLEHLSHNLKIFSKRWATSSEFARVYIFKWHLHIAGEALGAGLLEMAREHMELAASIDEGNEKLALLSARFALATGKGFDEVLNRVKTLAQKETISTELLKNALTIAYRAASNGDSEWILDKLQTHPLSELDEEDIYYAGELARRGGQHQRARALIEAYERVHPVTGRRIAILKRRLSS